MRTVRVSLQYHYLRVNDFPIFAVGVRDGIYGNATVFATPPILQADLQTLIDTYNTARAAYENGGTAQKGPYLAAKTALNGGLDQLAEYVDSVALGDGNIIMLSGFVPTKSTTSDAPVPVQLTDVRVSRGSTGEVMVECEKLDGASNYACIMTEGTPLPSGVVLNAKGQLVFLVGDVPGAAASSVIDFNPTRRKLFIGLTPGSLYYFVMFASNASGVGPLSASVSIMCA